MIKLWRRNWYWVGGVIFMLLAFFLIFTGEEVLSRIQVILVCSWMGMLIHQIEEYGWPGGFPSITNIAVLKEKKIYDHYPFNANLSFFDNVFTTYAFYIVPIFLPDLIWLGLAQVLAGVIQVLVHGFGSIITKMYNPGLLSAFFVQTPIAAYYIWYITDNSLAKTSDFVFGIIGGFVGLLLVFIVPVALMRNKDSKYPFEEREIWGYGEKKIKKMLEENSSN